MLTNIVHFINTFDARLAKLTPVNEFVTAVKSPLVFSLSGRGYYPCTAVISVSYYTNDQTLRLFSLPIQIQFKHVSTNCSFVTATGITILLTTLYLFHLNLPRDCLETHILSN